MLSNPSSCFSGLTANATIASSQKQADVSDVIAQGFRGKQTIWKSLGCQDKGVG